MTTESLESDIFVIAPPTLPCVGKANLWHRSITITLIASSPGPFGGAWKRGYNIECSLLSLAGLAGKYSVTMIHYPLTDLYAPFKTSHI